MNYNGRTTSGQEGRPAIHHTKIWDFADIYGSHDRIVHYLSKVAGHGIVSERRADALSIFSISRYIRNMASLDHYGL
jgi:hypothetical protein